MGPKQDLFVLFDHAVERVIMRAFGRSGFVKLQVFKHGLRKESEPKGNPNRYSVLLKEKTT